MFSIKENERYGKRLEKNIKKDDDNPGGDFLSLSGKDI